MDLKRKASEGVMVALPPQKKVRGELVPTQVNNALEVLGVGHFSELVQLFVA